MMRSSLSGALAWLAAIGRMFVYAEFAFAVASFVYLGIHLSTDVFGASPAALPVEIKAVCRSAEARKPCNASTALLTPGRVRVVTDGPVSEMTLHLAPEASISRAHTLLVRLAKPMGRVNVTPSLSDGTALDAATVDEAGVRAILSLPSAAPVTQLHFVPEGGDSARFAIDELGLYEDSRGLSSDVRAVFPWIPPLEYYGIVVPRAILPFCFLTVFAAFVIPRSVLKRVSPVALAAVCFTFCVLDLAIRYSPYGPGDLRVFYAAGPLQEPAGNNLNEGLWQAWRFLQGQGLTIVPRVVPWERMPGYSLFCSAAALLFSPSSLLDLALATILLQVCFYCAAVGVFAWTAGMLFPPAVVWTLGILIALLPKQLGYTQVDSVIAPVALLLLSALCVRLKTSVDNRQAPLLVDVLVHAAFALWFLMRPDVLPGWFVVALILHWKNWRRLLIPLTLSIAIGMGWGAYKWPYTHEFVPTTSSLGATLLCGLWEVPSRFASTCSDDEYFDWITRETSLQPKTQAASGFATREVVKFWLTYPGHFVIMVDHKMMQGLDGGFWPGFRTDLQRGTDTQRIVSRVLGRPVATLLLMTIIALCIGTGHQRLRTILLGWPLLFNAPLFWIMQSTAGRFYSAVPIGLLAAAVPPLFERQFYQSIGARPWRSAAVFAGALTFATLAWPLHDWLLRNDALHYWTPFLDPSKSSLNTLR